MPPSYNRRSREADFLLLQGVCVRRDGSMHSLSRLVSFSKVCPPAQNTIILEKSRTGINEWWVSVPDSAVSNERPTEMKEHERKLNKIKENQRKWKEIKENERK